MFEYLILSFMSQKLIFQLLDVIFEQTKLKLMISLNFIEHLQSNSILVNKWSYLIFKFVVLQLILIQLFF